jgi:hypothetical protein
MLAGNVVSIGFWSRLAREADRLLAMGFANRKMNLPARVVSPK